MDTNRKNNDCYFYYYSTCMKGDKCLFRHEESALGCEEVCSHWQQGKCFNQRCNLRHMELKKNRKAIQCYWESKPTGCCKPHCPFRHDLPRKIKSNEGSIETGIESANHTQTKINNQGSESNFGNPPVDPLVVNFEEGMRLY
uniref:C3H1-type domain-containing protein n=1 Tax=Clastoptera arizonana TaxID=38151 RepID=A0A1B6CA87_9HEMI